MSIKRKILLGYGIGYLLLCVVIVWGIVHIVQLGKATDAILSENYRSILAAENMIDALERQDSAILLIIGGNREIGIEQFREYEADFIEWLTRAKDNITIEGEAEVLATIESTYQIYRMRFAELTGEVIAEQASDGFQRYTENLYPLFLSVRTACIELRNLNQHTMYVASETAGKVAKQAIWSTCGAAGLALLVVTILSLITTERVVAPIRRFIKAAKQIASGDYDIERIERTGDELGELAQEFNKMAQQLANYRDMNIDQIVTERNKSETILASIEDGVIVCNPALRLVSTNPAAKTLLALGQGEFTGVELHQILPMAKVQESMRLAMTGNMTPALPLEQRIFSLEGSAQTKQILFSVSPVLGRDNHPTGAILLLRDVTRLREVEHLKDEFVMAASHELRTPLTGLSMSIKLMLEEFQADAKLSHPELLETAHQEVQRMTALINDLLDLSKIESGRIEMQFAKISLPKLFNHVSEVFKSQLEIKGLQLTTTSEEALPTIKADETKITWVLTNLISNAIRYVKEHQGVISLSAVAIGPFVHVSVADNGVGIPPELQSRLFEKFVQGRGQHQIGSGLGLAICKEIVRAHGGTIWVESAQGKGSVFTFTIPSIN